MEQYPAPKKLNNFSDNTLDIEFRQILCVIKQFIPYVSSNSHLSVYRSWLEKLSSVQTDKANRNRYLIELAKQVKGNVIGYPFDKNPPVGALEHFEEVDSDLELTEETNPSFDDINYNNYSLPLASFPMASTEIGRNIFSANNVRDHCPNHITSSKMAEESSWCDLTDGSVISVLVDPNSTGDAKNETKIQQPTKGNININTGELVDYKASFNNTNFVPADVINMIETLKMRLKKTLNQNEELKRMIEAQDEALSVEVQTREEIERQLKKSSELYEKQTEALRVKNEAAFKKFETNFQVELNDVRHSHQIRMEEMKSSYEARIAEMKLELEDEKKAKDTEICRLSEIIHQQCARMSNEIADLKSKMENNYNRKPEDKIILLQKCLSKLNKFYQKSEQEYLKQIEKLKQDLEFKDKMHLVQMQAKQAESAVQSSVERQKHIDDVINNLEVKYIKMLELNEKQVLESKRIDEERIKYLKDLLEQHHVPFKVF